MSFAPSGSSCPLCLRGDRELRFSHIIPAFAGRYLKETSATGFLRDGINPNIRRQDIAKQAMLCGDCEQIFSKWEREFSLKAFPTVQADDYKELVYGSWLLKFVVSISWRILVSNHEEVVEDSPQFKDVIATTLENWRLYLLDERKSPGSIHHLFVFAGVPKSMTGVMHEKTLHYMLRGIDATEIATSRQLGVYSKMLRSIFYSPLVPQDPKGWSNTRIHAGPGRLVSPQELSMPGFADFLQRRIKEVFATPLSDTQSQKITQAMLKDPERAISSESFKVHQANRRFSGNLRRPPTDENS